MRMRRTIQSKSDVVASPKAFIVTLIEEHRWAQRDVRHLAARCRRLAAELGLDTAGVYALCEPLFASCQGLKSSAAGAELVASALERERRRRAAQEPEAG